MALLGQAGEAATRIHRHWFDLPPEVGSMPIMEPGVLAALLTDESQGRLLRLAP